MGNKIKAGDIYPITTVTYPNGGGSQDTISVVHMEEYTAPVKLREFEQWMKGQTMSVDGYYVSDVERWLNGQGVDD